MEGMPRQPKVVVADDQPAVLEALEEFFRDRGYEVVACPDGGDALTQIRQAVPDLLVVDASMPVLSGMDVIRHVRFVCAQPTLPALVITGRADPRITEEALRTGANAVLNKPFRLNELQEAVTTLENGGASSPPEFSVAYDPERCLAAAGILETSPSRAATTAYGRSLGQLARALDRRDPHGPHHSVHVAELAILAATALGVEPTMRPILRLAGLLHDVAKLELSNDALSGLRPLDEHDRQVLREHPVRAGSILEPVVPDAAAAVTYHHERWDGSGYPTGLEGEDIPRSARILAVCEAYAAMTTRTGYEKPLPPVLALEQLQSGSGSQFDPTVVDAFERLILKPVACSVA